MARAETDGNVIEASSRLPRVTENGSVADPMEGVAASRDTIFDRLVLSEADVTGLLAYSLAKQNKRDWLGAFKAAKGRDPNGDELDAYDIGEMIDRRLVTYRKLAESALNGNAFWAAAAIVPATEMSETPPAATPAQAVAPPPMFDTEPAKAKDSWFAKKR